MRRLHAAVAVVSALLCVFVSFQWADNVIHPDRYDRVNPIIDLPFHLTIYCLDCVSLRRFSPPDRPEDVNPRTPLHSVGLTSLLGQGNRLNRLHFGFDVRWCRTQGPLYSFPARIGVLWSFELTVPYWFAVMLTAPLPIMWARRTAKARLRSYRYRMGWCTECGYDLRASPGECPECGAPQTPSAPHSDVVKGE
jgi:hypothetical protein